MMMTKLIVTYEMFLKTFGCFVLIAILRTKCSRRKIAQWWRQDRTKWILGYAKNSQTLMPHGKYSA